MKGYFNNPEIRKSSIVLFIILSIFLISSYFVIKVNNENLKKDYLNVLGGVTAKIVENNPQLEEEIISLMTREITKEEEHKGREILRDYGLHENLEINLFPYIKTTYQNSVFNILLLGIVLSGLLLILNYLQYRHFYNSVRNFSTAAKKIIEGDYHLKLSETNEGDLSKLTQSFNSMGETIRSNIIALRKEKMFLVDLLSDISHQLKTPLSTMILYNDIMLTKNLSKEQRETFLKNNQNQLNRMRWLIQNLLKLAKIDANAIDLEMDEQSLNDTIKEVIEILEDKAFEKKVNIDFNFSQNVSFMHDRLWLQEAFINIIKNAIEHSKQNETVAVNLVENPAYIRVIFNNTGEIISEVDLANIFKRFYKGESVKKMDSIGIGLSLAKSIIEKHGGFIEAKSNHEEGTSFIVTFLKY